MDDTTVYFTNPNASDNTEHVNQVFKNAGEFLHSARDLVHEFRSDNHDSRRYDRSEPYDYDPYGYDDPDYVPYAWGPEKNPRGRRMNSSTDNYPGFTHPNYGKINNRGGRY